MVKKKLGLFSSSVDEQEQPFVQVIADRSIWIWEQRLAAVSTGWCTMLISFGSRIEPTNPFISALVAMPGSRSLP